jgi:HTH-type transcriptional regulator/antitoxin MqsA
MREDQMRCPETGTSLKRGVRRSTISYKGRTATFMMGGWYPPRGMKAESIHSGIDMRASDAALARLKAEAGETLRPDEVRTIRRKLKLSQRKASELLGGGPRAFQKYESGEVSTSAPMSKLLRLLAKDPKRLKELQE